MQERAGQILYYEIAHFQLLFTASEGLVASPLGCGVAFQGQAKQSQGQPLAITRQGRALRGWQGCCVLCASQRFLPFQGVLIHSASL